MKEILQSVSEFIKNKHSSKKWQAGKDWVQYAGPYFDENEYVAAVETLLNEWLVLGEKAIEFENKFPILLGKNHGVVTNSGSSSNLLMMAAMQSKKLYNLPKGTKVITPAAGFPTTLNPILQLGFSPVFVDIELNSLNIDVAKLEDSIKTSGANIITFAHVLGNPPNMNVVMELVKKYNLILLEDCCDALGSTYNGVPLGSFGEYSSCSFYPAHHMTMGEGGFVACKTHEQETVVRSLREWGRGCYCVGKKANLSTKGCCGKRFSNWIESMPTQIFDHKYVYDEIGYNLKPIELQCAIGLEQIKKLPVIHDKRKENHRRLFSIFSKYEEFFILPKATENADVSWFAFPLTLRDNCPFKRQDLINHLEMNKIQTRLYFGGCLLLQPAYSHLINKNDVINMFPNSVKSMKDSLFLGTSPVITAEQYNYINEIVDKFFTKS